MYICLFVREKKAASYIEVFSTLTVSPSDLLAYALFPLFSRAQPCGGVGCRVCFDAAAIPTGFEPVLFFRDREVP